MKKIFKESAKLIKYYEIFHCTALCIGLMLLANHWLALSFHNLIIFIAALACQFIIHETKERKHRLTFYISVVITILMTILLLYKNKAEPASYYQYLCLEAICLLFSIICYTSKQRIWLKLTINLILLSGLIYFSIQKITLSKWGIYLILFCFLLFLADISSFPAHNKSGQKELYLTPVFLIALLLLLFLPVKESPIRWQPIKDFYKTVREEINALIINVRYIFDGGSGDYSLSFSGYGGDGQVKGNALNSDNPQISIQGSQTKRPLYLSGSTYYSYTGQGWETGVGGISSANKEYPAPSDDLLTALDQSIYTIEDRKEFITKHYYNVEYAGLKTKSLFYPTHTANIEISPPTYLIKNDRNDVSLSRAKGVGFIYRVNFYEIDYTNEKMQYFLRGKAWKNTPTDSALSETKKKIYEDDTILPDTVPERVYDLAKNITARADNDYDRLKAIERYVSNHTYTLTPGAVPEHTDITDYFLFESKSGYCTYFATAMAVLARCEGIPTRYVEGMVSQDACRYHNQLLNLKGRNAHAWVEAYIPHIGWIPFEPTPGYYEKANQVLEAPKPSSAAAPVVPDFMPEMPLSTDSVSQSEEEISFFYENRMLLLQIAKETLLLIIILLLCTYSILFLKYKIKNRWYQKKSGYEKIIFHMNKIFYIGKLYGYPIENDETLSGYHDRTNHCLDTSYMIFSDLCSLYQSIRFGQKKVLLIDIEAMETYTHLLEKHYLKKCGFFKGLLYYIH